MAHIQRVSRKTKDGRRVTDWRVRYRDPDGRERQHTEHRRIDAERWRTDNDSKLQRGEWIDPDLGKTTLREWSEPWLKTTGPTLKPKTLASYESLLGSRILPTLGDFPLAGLRPSDVQTWIGEMQEAKLSPSRIRQAHVVLRSMLETAGRDRYLGRNPAQGARLPKLQRKEAPSFEPSTVDSIIEATPEPYACFIAVQGMLGLRFGEAAALRRRSVNLLRRRITVDETLAEIGKRLIFGPTKSHAQRTVPIPAPLVAALAAHLENVPSDADSLLFESPSGGPMRYTYFRAKVWKTTLESLKLPYAGMHTLRHSAAARMIASEWSALAVSQALGHASVAFTLTRYGHLFDSDWDALADQLISTSRGHDADNARQVAQVESAE